MFFVAMAICSAVSLFCLVNIKDHSQRTANSTSALVTEARRTNVLLANNQPPIRAQFNKQDLDENWPVLRQSLDRTVELTEIRGKQNGKGTKRRSTWQNVQNEIKNKRSAHDLDVPACDKDTVKFEISIRVQVGVKA